MTKLSDLLGTRTIPVDVLGHTVTVTYRLSERTVERVENIDLTESVASLFLRLIESWDLLGENGKPLPISEKALAQVPIPVLHAIHRGIIGDIGLGEASSSSDAG